jgi:beta-N-acetylhexosaminidase
MRCSARSRRASPRGSPANGVSVAGPFLSVLAKVIASLAMVGAGLSTSGGGAPAGGPGLRAGVPAQKLLGQRIMVGFSGTSPPGSLLAQVRAGKVGSVILFSANVGSRTQLKSLTASLQRAARQGHNPPLLISVDQEGGEVKRLQNGPPTLSPPQMARTGRVTVAFQQGLATGRYLRSLGINMDLAPVVDVPTFSGAFIWQQGRAFSFNAQTVASYGSAFALGLQRARVAATAKHFPGLGSAGIDTDNKRQELHPTQTQWQAGLAPYRKLIPRGLKTVMLTVAGYPSHDRSGAAAALSRPIIQGVLRGQLHFKGVTITDALGTPTGHDEITAGVLAAQAGSDILLYTDSAPGELRALEHALSSGQLNRTEAEQSYARIVALKRAVG